MDAMHARFIREYAVGKFGDTFPKAPHAVKPGAKILANVHVHADGEDTPMNIAVACASIRSYVPKHVAHAQQLGRLAISHPANTKNVRAMAYHIELGRRDHGVPAAHA